MMLNMTTSAGPGDMDRTVELIRMIAPGVVVLIVVIMTVSIGCLCYHRKKRKRDLANFTTKDGLIVLSEDLRHASSEGRLVVNVSLLDHQIHAEVIP